MIGMIPNTPGPRSARNRPRRKTTARSHGAATLIALATIDAAMNATQTTMMEPVTDLVAAYGT